MAQMDSTSFTPEEDKAIKEAVESMTYKFYEHLAGIVAEVNQDLKSLGLVMRLTELSMIPEIFIFRDPSYVPSTQPRKIKLTQQDIKFLHGLHISSTDPDEG